MKYELIERYVRLASMLEECQTVESALQRDVDLALNLAADDLLVHILTCRICRFGAN